MKNVIIFRKNAIRLLHTFEGTEKRIFRRPAPATRSRAARNYFDFPRRGAYFPRIMSALSDESRAQIEALAEELSFPFSIRYDVMQEQFNRMRDGIVVNKYLYPPIQIDQVDRERDKKILDEILEEAVPYPHLTAELSEIFEEELNRYQKQLVGLEEVVANIGKRVQLYLDE